MLNIIKNFKKKMNFQPHLLFLVHPFYFSRRNLFKAFQHYSPKLSGDLLDIGCGSMPYKKLFTHCNSYIGLEIETEKSNEFADYTYDGKTFPFENESYDSAICSEVLEHVFEPNIFLKEINRVMKKNGLIILTLPFIWDEHEQPYDYARYTSFGLKYILEKENFEVLEQKKICNNLSIISQLINCYFYKKMYHKKNFLFKNFSLLIFLFFNLIGLILSIFPKNKDMYLDNLVIAKKK
jgi:SAM-dependent methyltransferase